MENNAQERKKNQAAAVEFIQGFFFTSYIYDHYNDALFVNESFFLYYHSVG